MRPASVADEGAANEHEGGDRGALRRDYLDASGVWFRKWAGNRRYSKARFGLDGGRGRLRTSDEPRTSGFLPLLDLVFQY